jgi:hypothetical protein
VALPDVGSKEHGREGTMMSDNERIPDELVAAMADGPAGDMIERAILAGAAKADPAAVIGNIMSLGMLAFGFLLDDDSDVRLAEFAAFMREHSTGGDLTDEEVSFELARAGIVASELVASATAEMAGVAVNKLPVAPPTADPRLS